MVAWISSSTANAVVGMDPLKPPCPGGFDLIETVAVGGTQRVAPEDVTADEIPVPDRVVGGLRDEAVALLRRPKREPGLLADRDVAHSLDEAYRAALPEYLRPRAASQRSPPLAATTTRYSTSKLPGPPGSRAACTALSVDSRSAG